MANSFQVTSQDSLTRRDVLRVGSLTALGLSLDGRLRARSAQASGLAAAPVAKRCVLIWLDGGPSHLDTFDLKPDAPREVRGPFQPIDTNVPGMRISELLPRTAQQADKLAIVRSMTSPLGEHNLGAHYLLTGYRPSPVLRYPSYGAVLSQVRNESRILPGNISIPEHSLEGGAGFLPRVHAPFAVGADPARGDFKIRDLDPFPGVDAARLSRRREYLHAFDRMETIVESAVPSGDSQFEQAYRLISSPAAREAFDLSRETPETRDRYGRRTLGQACLLARRLLEADVPFVTVFDRGWDTHQNIYTALKEGFPGGAVGKIPTLDLAYAALLADLADRRMLDETLVVLMGEFGRTPRINVQGGRDHWPRVFSVVLAGGGVAGGQIIGSSDAHGESPRDRPVPPEDLAHTIYRQLGVDPRLELHTSDGRPVMVNIGTLIDGLASGARHES